MPPGSTSFPAEDDQPTRRPAEALKIVGLSFFKDVSKMSCCAE
jgi:hypothetical protein